MVRVFTNGTGDQSSIPGQVILKTQKIVLDPSLLNTQQYKVRVKWSNPGNGVASSPTPWCNSYQKGSLRLMFDYSHKFTLHKIKTGKSLFCYVDLYFIITITICTFWSKFLIEKKVLK